jgi:hypothetical protein
MVSVKWDNGDWYATRNRNTYRRLDKLLNKEFDRADEAGSLDLDTLQKIDTLASRKLSCVHSNLKIAGALTIIKQINRLNVIIDCIPADILGKYYNESKNIPSLVDRVE